MVVKHCVFIVVILLNYTLFSQTKFSKQDTLRGSITPERSWWDVKRYDLEIEPFYSKQKIIGRNTVTFFTIRPGQKMQIDLQEPMELDSVIFAEEKTTIERIHNVYYLVFENELLEDKIYEITLYFSGKPRKAINAPWDGGWIWSKDTNGNPWMTVACQGLGASSWYPCKDHQSDEPDLGAKISIKVPSDFVAVSNGKFVGKKEIANNKTIYYWEVKNPINAYNIVPYIGKYVHWSDYYMGEKGKLLLDYWVLEGNLDRSKKQFEQVKSMLSCFEKWFGPYPFYEDGYKLVESPHLGMEHQSAIAYGNKYKNGYEGSDLSQSGTGHKWDFIIVHESGHEWFGNSITSKDIADMWIHEAFTSYSEVLYTECLFGKEAANNYLIGIRNRIKNDVPIIATYGINQEGSGDMYFKGSNLIHIIRQLLNDEVQFQNLLREINKKFYHQTITSTQLERFILEETSLPLEKVFDQYLRTTQIPTLEIKSIGDGFQYRWVNCVSGFAMKVRNSKGHWISPTEEWSVVTKWPVDFGEQLFDHLFYIKQTRIQ